MAKILVIEDQLEVRQNIEDILTLEDYEVISAPDGETGLALAKQHLPDLILCDVMMPRVTGFEVLMTLRQDQELAVIPFILLTAKADHHAFRQGMELGADDYLTKPFTIDELLHAITSRLDRHYQRQAMVESRLDNLRQHVTRSLPHELLTPLNGILGTSQLMINFYDSLSHNEVMESLHDIKTSGERLYRLVENFLLMADLDLLLASPARLQVWQSRLSQYTELPSSLVPMLENLGQNQPRRQDVEMMVVPQRIQVAEPDFQKIIRELIDNAFKFSLPGTPVQLEAVVKNGLCELTIQDHGRGMTKEELGSIGAHVQFQRSEFEQQGSGLGLTLAQRLTELYGGQLAIASVPGEGTTITIQGWESTPI
ncbi:hybrid sensor histidine kinase/response regulator [Synechocystis sp. FACHB-383]|uniref:hybrid sensor histidine kinase/response regulator n=1 Tax=Synechocystis sp. FACHB-383 TaxID=2692864 RepID=UPI001682EC23|nr:hybrid sensor histidine kinase/response regulator [Synechocystis sp. FACHB-383]MBD2653458.1 hybrid sensor histidine kinase/response regulator [Synechocystis sp. FACHB-383]